MTQDLSERTRSSLYWKVLLRGPYECLHFVASVIVARILGPTDFGIVSIATMTIMYCNVITNFGLNNALVQRKEITDRHINSIFTVDLMISLMMVLLFYMIAPFLASFFNSPESKNVIRTLCVLFVLTTFHDMSYAIFKRNIDFGFLSKVDLVREMGIAALTLILAICGLSYWAVVWGQLIPFFLITCYLVHRVDWSPRLRYHHNAIKEVFNFGSWNFVWAQTEFFRSRMDRLAVSKMLGPTALGLYDRAKSLYHIPSDNIVQNVNSVLFSTFSRAQDDSEYLAHTFKKGLLLTSIIGFPLYGGLYILADDFVSVVLGAKWVSMTTALQVLSLGGFFMSLQGLLSVLNMATGKYKIFTVGVLVNTGFFVLACLFLARIGIEAVAVGVLFFNSLLFFFSFSLAKKRIHLSWRDFSVCILPATLGTAAILISVKICKSIFFEGPSIISLTLLAIIAGAVYIAVLALIRTEILDGIKASIQRDCRDLLDRFINVLKKRRVV